ELGVEWANLRSRAEDLLVRARLADAALALDGVHLGLDALTRDLDEGEASGTHWFRLVSGVKVRSVAAARGAVDAAIEVAGGAAYSASGELGRLYRDVLAGVFQPSSVDATRSMIAGDLLGPLDE
ncbi:MAG TPA: acyl-CoA dehydrogenase family protein, partial [Terrimesophilobacter sp.]|nr:acyl-CoA dehydrogenase family protein [Terrimesophilobacter sp.]